MLTRKLKYTIEDENLQYINKKCEKYLLIFFVSIYILN